MRRKQGVGPGQSPRRGQKIPGELLGVGLAAKVMGAGLAPGSSGRGQLPWSWGLSRADWSSGQEGGTLQLDRSLLPLLDKHSPRAWNRREGKEQRCSEGCPCTDEKKVLQGPPSG